MAKFNVYHENNQYRKTGLTRSEAIEHYNLILNFEGVSSSNIHIYCQDDYYVSNYWIKEFLDLNDENAKIKFDEGGVLLENTPRGLKYRDTEGRIVFIKDNVREYI